MTDFPTSAGETPLLPLETACKRVESMSHDHFHSAVEPGRTVVTVLFSALSWLGMVENVLWPAYFDAELTRSAGRRVATDLAVTEPEVDEIATAVQQIGYDAVIERDKTYPRAFDPRGRVLVTGAKDTKNDLVQAVGAYLGVLRE
jgi:Signal recognition particle 19 kDa protein